MAYRFTNTDKWSDAWFSNLKPDEKLLFIYFYENCDMAGFLEMNIKRWIADTSLTKSSIEGALKGLQRGLIYSQLKDCIYIRTFLKHQKNLPLNPEKNPAHRGIIKRFECYRLKFDIHNIIEFIEGALKGLSSPLGNGNGNDIGNIKKGEKPKFIPPTLNEIKLYFKENGYKEESAIKAWKYYEAANWHDSQGMKIKNWKQKCIAIWFKDEHKLAGRIIASANPNTYA